MSFNKKIKKVFEFSQFFFESFIDYTYFNLIYPAVGIFRVSLWYEQFCSMGSWLKNKDVSSAFLPITKHNWILINPFFHWFVLLTITESAAKFLENRTAQNQISFDLSSFQLKFLKPNSFWLTLKKSITKHFQALFGSFSPKNCSLSARASTAKKIHCDAKGALNFLIKSFRLICITGGYKFFYYYKRFSN